MDNIVGSHGQHFLGKTENNVWNLVKVLMNYLQHTGKARQHGSARVVHKHWSHGAAWRRQTSCLVWPCTSFPGLFANLFHLSLPYFIMSPHIFLPFMFPLSFFSSFFLFVIPILSQFITSLLQCDLLTICHFGALDHYWRTLEITLGTHTHTHKSTLRFKRAPTMQKTQTHTDKR